MLINECIFLWCVLIHECIMNHLSTAQLRYWCQLFRNSLVSLQGPHHPLHHLKQTEMNSWHGHMFYMYKTSVEAGDTLPAAVQVQPVKGFEVSASHVWSHPRSFRLMVWVQYYIWIRSRSSAVCYAWVTTGWFVLGSELKQLIQPLQRWLTRGWKPRTAWDLWSQALNSAAWCCIP